MSTTPAVNDNEAFEAILEEVVFNSKDAEWTNRQMQAITAAHQAALAARDAEWTAAVEELKSECWKYETVTLKSDAVENLDALLAKLKGGK